MEYYEDYEEYELVTEEELHTILENYRREKLKESICGPAFSGFFHVMLIVFLSFFAVSKYNEEAQHVEIVIEEVETKEPPPIKDIPEIEEVEPEVTEDVPAMEVPDVPTEISDTSFEDFNDEAPQTDDNFDFEEVLDIVPNQTPLKISGFYGGRTESGRSGSVNKYGGSKEGQDAVLKALIWLAKVQEDNGSWVDKPERTGMALLCFLAYGATPLDKEFGVTVQKAMQWLSTNMPKNGMFGGRAYSHGIATYAISEAYGMTHIPFLKEAMENGIETIINGQQNNGGFDYRYSKGPRWDLSVSGWQFQAMKAAYVSGSSNERLYDAIEKSKNFLKKSAYRNYKFDYSEGRSNENMIGVGTVALQLLGEPEAKEVSQASQVIMDKRLEGYKWINSSKKLYGWYYDTQAIFQYGSVRNKESWRKWKSVFEKVLVQNQKKEGYWETEESHQMWGPTLSGRVLATTFCCLQLEVYYRYLPTFKIQPEFNASLSKNISDIDDTDLIID